MPKTNVTKVVKADLDSPRRELSNSGLGIVVAVLVPWQIDFVLVYDGGPSNPAVVFDTRGRDTVVLEKRCTFASGSFSPNAELK